jgi:hypothetical protein
LRSARVNGTLYAFDRVSGKVRWFAEVPAQMMLLDQFEDLPVILFSARYNPLRNQPQIQQTLSATLSLDKRTGKPVYQAAVNNYNQGQFYELSVDRQAGVFDLVTNNLKLRHYIEGGGYEPGSGARESRSGFRRQQPAPGGAGPPQPRVVPLNKLPQAVPARDID